MKKISVLMILSLLAAAAFTAFGAFAKEEGGLSTRIDVIDESTVRYTVDSNISYENAMTVLAAYEGDRMCGIMVDESPLGAEKITGSYTFEKTFDYARLFVLDKTTLAPLCGAKASNDRYNVEFRNYDGSILDTVTVGNGEKAPLPDTPERDGYIFRSWSADNSSVYDDTEITAQFVDENASNIFEIPSVTGAVEELVTVSVKLSGEICLCGFDMRLLYDPDSLEFVSMDPELSFDLVANHSTENNSVRFNFSSSKNRTRGGGVLDVTFRIKQGITDTVVKLEPVEVLKADAETAGFLHNADHELTEGVILVR